MPVYIRDTDRLEQAINRLRWSIKTLPFVVVPLCCVICSASLRLFGPVAALLGGIGGFLVGLYASIILAAVIEWMILVLIYLDDNA